MQWISLFNHLTTQIFALNSTDPAFNQYYELFLVEMGRVYSPEKLVILVKVYVRNLFRLRFESTERQKDAELNQLDDLD